MISMNRWFQRSLFGKLITLLGVIVFGLVAGLLPAKSEFLAILLILGIVALLAITFIFFKDGVFSFQRVLVPLLAASILLPSIRLPAGIPAVRLELIIAFVAWTLLILGHFATGQPLKFCRSPVYKWFVLFGLAIILSMAYATLAKGYPLIGRDFWELFKLLEYFLIFALVANLDIPGTDVKRYYKIAFIVFLCSAFFGFAQYLNLGNINAVVSPWYVPAHHMRGLFVHRRITGTTGNPNEFGGLMVLASSLALSGALFFRQRMMRLFSWACLAAFSLAIVLTLSRSALVTLTVAVCFISLVRYPFVVGIGRGVPRVLVALAIMALIGLIIAQVAPAKFFLRVSELRDIASDTSWQLRLAKWQDEFALWTRSPLFGWGPGKATMTTIVDNEWLLLLRRYGLVGILVFISWFASFYFGLSKIRRGSSAVEVTALTIALQATLIAYAAYMIPAGVYHSLQLMPIVILFLGLAYSQMRNQMRNCIMPRVKI